MFWNVPAAGTPFGTWQWEFVCVFFFFCVWHFDTNHVHLLLKMVEPSAGVFIRGAQLISCHWRGHSNKLPAGAWHTAWVRWGLGFPLQCFPFLSRGSFAPTFKLLREQLFPVLPLLTQSSSVYFPAHPDKNFDWSYKTELHRAPVPVIRCMPLSPRQKVSKKVTQSNSMSFSRWEGALHQDSSTNQPGQTCSAHHRPRSRRLRRQYIVSILLPRTTEKRGIQTIPQQIATAQSLAFPDGRHTQDHCALPADSAPDCHTSYNLSLSLSFYHRIGELFTTLSLPLSLSLSLTHTHTLSLAQSFSLSCIRCGNH